MRKYLLPSIICLLLAAGLAGAQTINKALQLSQDATGIFAVDSFNGVYFSGHILSPPNGPRPNPTIAGNSTPSLVGTDTAGLITFGSTTATVTFGTAYQTAPWCVLSPQSGANTLGYTITTTSIAVVSALANQKGNYMCVSAS